MTRKEMEAFNLSKLKKGHSRSFEVRNRTTKFANDHFFYKSMDGDIFHVIARHDRALQLKNQWLLHPNRNAFVKSLKTKNYEAVPGCPCVNCKPVESADAKK